MFLLILIKAIINVVMYGYLPNAIFISIIFGIWGIDKIYAYIPVYNFYRLFKEYQGRVWKKNWGIYYILYVVLSIIIIIVLSQLYILEEDIQMAIQLILGTLILIFRIIILVIQYLPVLNSKVLKGVLLLNIILLLVLDLTEILSELYILIIGLVFAVVYIIQAYIISYKVDNDEYIPYEKLDYSKLSSSDIKAELTSRGRVLVHPVEQTEKLEQKTELNEEKEQLEKSN